jgi:hypothetical protein
MEIYPTMKFQINNFDSVGVMLRTNIRTPPAAMGDSIIHPAFD